MPSLTIDELAVKVGGTVHRTVEPSSIEHGNIGQGTTPDPSTTLITSLQPLESAKAGDVTFFAPKSKRDTSRLGRLLQESSASAVFLASPLLDEKRSDNLGAKSFFRGAQILVKNPYLAAITAARFFSPAPVTPAGVHPTAVVDPTATIAPGASIGAYVVIGQNVQIGQNVVLHPHVVVYQGVTIGADSVIHAGAVIREFSVLGQDCLIQPGVVIGGDGFGYVPDRIKGHERIPHIGITVLEDRVDIGANSTVDRATFGETRIKSSAKIDNLVMVGHNCIVGARTFLCSLVGLSGSTTVGDDCIFAGQAGAADHLTIGNRVRVAAKGGVTNDVPDNIDISGMPHQEVRVWRREQAALRKLPELLQRLRPVLKTLPDKEGLK